MIRMIAVLLLAILTSCYRPHVVKTSPVNAEEMTWIVMETVTKFEHERRLRLEHSRAMYVDGTVAGLQLEFSTQEILEVKEARELLVDLVEFLILDINTNPIVSEELIAYPFTAGGLNIEINFESFLVEYVDPYYVGCVRLDKGMAYYYAGDVKDTQLYRWHSRVEPYAKSLEVVRLSRAAEETWQEEHHPHHLNALRADQYYPEPSK
jgi:hypothetical protein